MIYTVLTKKALQLCFEAHKHQVEKTGLPYVFHPFHLTEQMTDEISTVCTLLHDVIEDTDYTFDNLREMGFPQEVIDVLELLTHDERVPYMEYVKNIKRRYAYSLNKKHSIYLAHTIHQTKLSPQLGFLYMYSIIFKINLLNT